MTSFIFSQTILLPLLVGVWRFKTIRVNYLPFFLSIVLGLVTELISRVLIHQYHSSNAVPTNLFVLAEWLLLAWQFKVWGLLRKRKELFYLLVAIPVFVWITENLMLGKIGSFSPYFRVIYAFLITLMSITEINFSITHENKSLFQNSVFIMCIGFVLFFVYKMLYEWSYQVSIIGESSAITHTVSSLFAYINALANVIFGIALLMVPVNKPFKLE
jgi:hypothetical protein